MTTRAKPPMMICLAACLVVQGISSLGAEEPDSGSEPGKLRDTILALDDHFWDATSRHDVETLSRLFADDYYGIGGDGSRWTKASILNQHRMARLGDLKRTSKREVIRIGEHAVLLTYDATFKVFTKDGVLTNVAHQRLISCWVQRDGGWFVRFSQATDLADSTTQAQPNDTQPDRRSRGAEEPRKRGDRGKPGINKTTTVSLRDATLDEVDAGRNAITVTIGKGITGNRRVSMRLVNLPVAKDAEIRISSRHYPSVANNLQRGLSELEPGMPASMELKVCQDEIVCPIVVSKIVGWREP
jgi:hypothetical protein